MRDRLTRLIATAPYPHRRLRTRITVAVEPLITLSPEQCDVAEQPTNGVRVSPHSWYPSIKARQWPGG